MSERDILDLDAFHELYPWNERLRGYGRPVEALWHFEFSATPEELWPYIADTSRFNRALGLPVMQFSERDGVRHGEASYGGIRATWIEEPWQWVRERHLSAVRIFDRGFAHMSHAIFHIDPIGATRSRLYAYFAMVPRGIIGRIWTALGMGSLERGYRRVMAELEREFVDGSAAGQPGWLVQVSEEPDILLQARLHTSGNALLADLAPTSEERPVIEDILDRLLAHIAGGDELDLYRIQVRALAYQWGVDESLLLRICLHATREGLLELSWDVICPHCRGVRDEVKNLGEVPARGSCEVCRIDFSTEPEDVVEIAFHVHPSIRHIPKQLFCSAEPSFKDHIQLQLALPPGQEKTVASALRAGRYRLRLEGEKRYRFLDVKSQADDGDAAVHWRASEAQDLATSENPALTLVNDHDDAETFIIERVEWLDFALRPARLFNLQEFRDLFSEQYLDTEVRLAVGAQAILFTDMVGSTRFYEVHGDPDAFAEIKKHFTELAPIVSAHHGAIVKTLGDAIMASFSSALDAVQAAHAIHECFHEYREDSPIRLRISLNLGPCIAVNLNSGIDYFGGTVNIAAKLQSCADAGDIAMTQDVYHGHGVREFLDEHRAIVHESTYHSRALGRDIPVFCWQTFRHRMNSADGAMAQRLAELSHDG